MNKLIFTLSVIICAMHVIAQTETVLYFKIKKIIEQTHPEIRLDGKLLAVNFWDVNDPESREANKNLEKAYTVYQNAKLKGGSKGLVVVTVSKEDLSSTATITLNKDGIVKTISLKSEDLNDQADTGTTKNLVFDSNGNEVYKDLPAASVFNSIHKLITR